MGKRFTEYSQFDLSQDFGLTAEDARTMYALSDKETYSREIYKALEKAGLSEVTE